MFSPEVLSSIIRASSVSLTQLSRINNLTAPVLSVLRCTYVSCSQTFVTRDSLKRHIKYAHGVKDCYYKVGGAVVVLLATTQRCAGELGSINALLYEMLNGLH